MNWRIKGLVQKALSVLPAGVHMNDVLQRTLGGLRDVEGTVDSKIVDDWVVLAETLRDVGVTIPGRDFVEIGTGWFPVLPLCFAVAGARSCHTFDIRRHLNPRLTARATDRLAVHLTRIAAAASVDRQSILGRYEVLRATRASVERTLAAMNITYVAPGDASASGLPANSVDVVFSNSVLEHVPADAIRRIFLETRRILRPGGVSVHSVNCGDHYAYFDRSITAINYLQYSDEQWRRWNNDLQYQNRLRPRDFLDLSREAGLKVISQTFRPKDSLMAILPALRVAPQFQRYSPEQLCATSLDFVATPNG